MPIVSSPSLGGAEQRPLGEHLAELKEVGYTVFRGHLDSQTVTALRDVLEPVFSAAFEADSAPKLKLGAGSVTGHRAGGSWPGGGLLRHPLWEPTLKPLLHHPWHSERILDFCELVMGPQVQMDAFGISGFPAHSPDDPPPPLCPRPPTFAWHRCAQALARCLPCPPPTLRP